MRIKLIVVIKIQIDFHLSVEVTLKVILTIINTTIYKLIKNKPVMGKLCSCALLFSVANLANLQLHKSNLKILHNSCALVFTIANLAILQLNKSTTLHNSGALVFTVDKLNYAKVHRKSNFKCFPLKC